MKDSLITRARKCYNNKRCRTKWSGRIGKGVCVMGTTIFGHPEASPICGTIPYIVESVTSDEWAEYEMNS